MKTLRKVLFGCLLLAGSHLYAQYPSSYDLRMLSQVSPVDDQGSCGACWAFATNAAIESAWLKQGGGVVDLSEDHLIDCHGFDEGPCFGGSYYMSQALLSRHIGPLNESSDPYTPIIQDCTSSLPFPPLPEAFVEEFRLLPAIEDSIKTALMNHGAVASTMYFTMSNYNASTYQYYDSQIDASDLPNAHCVTIVGWDDNMTFSNAPGNGGWIVKDSYGTSWAENGYFYCSYYDAGILEENAIFPVRQEFPDPPAVPSVYLLDEYGWVDNHGFANNTAYALAHYVVMPPSGVVASQQILRVGSYAVADNTLLEVALYSEKNGNILSGELASGSVTCPVKGFYTVPFDIPPVAPGTEIFVQLKYVGPSGVQNPIPIETVETNHTTNFSPSQNASWVSSNGDVWTLTGVGTSNNFDVCIKMYTETVDLSSVAETGEDFFEVYPNPSSHGLNINMKRTGENVTAIRIIDELGRVYRELSNPALQAIHLDVTHWPAGVYWVEVATNRKVHRRRVIKR